VVASHHHHIYPCLTAPSDGIRDVRPDRVDEPDQAEEFKGRNLRVLSRDISLLPTLGHSKHPVAL